MEALFLLTIVAGVVRLWRAPAGFDAHAVLANRIFGGDILFCVATVNGKCYPVLGTS